MAIAEEGQQRQTGDTDVVHGVAGTVTRSALGVVLHEAIAVPLAVLVLVCGQPLQAPCDDLVVGQPATASASARPVRVDSTTTATKPRCSVPLIVWEGALRRIDGVVLGDFCLHLDFRLHVDRCLDLDLVVRVLEGVDGFGRFRRGRLDGSLFVQLHRQLHCWLLHPWLRHQQDDQQHTQGVRQQGQRQPRCLLQALVNQVLEAVLCQAWSAVGIHVDPGRVELHVTNLLQRTSECVESRKEDRDPRPTTCRGRSGSAGCCATCATRLSAPRHPGESAVSDSPWWPPPPAAARLPSS